MLALNQQSGSSFSGPQIGELFAASVTFLCPSYNSALEQYDNKNGPIGSSSGSSTAASSAPASTTTTTVGGLEPLPATTTTTPSAYQQGYSEGYSGGSFFKTGSLSEDCQQAFYEDL